MPTETERAKAAFADYLAMGPGRSLEKLAEQYQNVTEPCPTRRLNTLKGWSTNFAWQDRIAAHGEKFREQQQDAADKARLENLTLVRAGKGEFAKALKSGKLKADSVSDLERLIKLEMQLLGAPLADRTELTGKDGGPVQAVSASVDIAALVSDDDGRELLTRLADKLFLESGDAADPGEGAD